MSAAPNKIDVTVGFNLSTLRAKRGLTQSALAGMCSPSLTNQQISKYERGESQIGAPRLVEFASLLGCRVSDFFDGVANLLPDGLPTSADMDKLNQFKELPEDIQASLGEMIQAMIKEFAQARSIKRIPL